MSELRRDPTTLEWVIIADERAMRPHELVQKGADRLALEFDEGCPFCPGHEHMTPPEVLTQALPGSERPWDVRVVPNRYPALRPDAPFEEGGDDFFSRMGGAGAHEVVIDTPIHNREMSRMDDREVEAVLLVYQQRYNALKADPRNKLVIIFKNKGNVAGTSLAHPHSQIVATPVEPPLVRRRYNVARTYYAGGGRCLYCDILQKEQRDGHRVVAETDRFLVFHPFASRWPFETWIMPKEHRSSFGDASLEELKELAPLLRSVLGALEAKMGDPDYNFVLHSAPTRNSVKPYYQWHLQIVPRLTTAAGFEIGSGMYINTALPEETAAFVRDDG
jgi:UDPglucose--hexose-1-phosphate uridylyltransferase